MRESTTFMHRGTNNVGQKDVIIRSRKPIGISRGYAGCITSTVKILIRVFTEE